MTALFSLEQNTVLKMTTLISLLPNLYILTERQSLVLHMCNQKYVLQKSYRKEQSYCSSPEQNIDAKDW